MQFARTPARLAVIGSAVAALGLPAAALAASPTASSAPADPAGIFDDAANIGGLVSPGGIDTSYAFQYGTTTAYGQTTPLRDAGSGKGDVPVDEALTGLAPATTYHYRILAFATDSGLGSAVYGADEAFTTAPRIGVEIVGRRLQRQGHRVLVTLRAIGPQDGTAAGHLTLSGRWNGARHWLGSTHYRLDVGQTKSVRIHLGKGALRAFDKAPSHRLNGRARARTHGNTTPTIKRLTLVG